MTSVGEWSEISSHSSSGVVPEIPVALMVEESGDVGRAYIEIGHYNCLVIFKQPPVIDPPKPYCKGPFYLCRHRVTENFLCEVRSKCIPVGKTSESYTAGQR